MRAISRGMMLLGLAAAWQAPSGAWAPPSPAAELLNEARIAVGATAWEKLPGVYEEGERGGARYQAWYDFQGFGMREETERDGAREIRAFNGSTAWRSGPQGVALESNASALADARTAAFLGAHGYFFPERFKARTRYLQLVNEGKRAFEIVEATPQGGRPVELWFDRKTRLLERIVDSKRPQPVTITLSDYRKAGKVKMPFRAVATDASGAVIGETVLRLVEHKPVPRASFDPPAAP